ncbi:MAG: recombination regulator RecX [Ruminococcus sp.]|jgi:regulatory protein|nr:recombination regulator RecX [Ruminococcus sp.]
MNDSSRKCIYTAYHYLSYKDYSEKTLMRKLSRDFPKDTAAAAIKELRELGIINDSRYAAKCIRQLMFTKKLGETRVRRELLQRGLTEETIEAALNEFNEASDYDPERMVRWFLEKNYTAEDLRDKDKLRKIYAQLTRRGFETQLIKHCIDDFDEIFDSEETLENPDEDD